jgi:hypothetical protein
LDWLEVPANQDSLDFAVERIMNMSAHGQFFKVGDHTCVAAQAVIGVKKNAI